jgi:hypothetical protein
MTMDNFQILDLDSFVISGTEWERVLFIHETDKRVIKVLQFGPLKMIMFILFHLILLQIFTLVTLQQS